MSDHVKVVPIRKPSERRRRLWIQARQLIQKTLAWGMFWTFGVAILTGLLSLISLIGLEVEFKHSIAGIAARIGLVVIFGLSTVAALRTFAGRWLRDWKEMPVRIWVIDPGRIDKTPGSERLAIPVRLENRSDTQTHQCGLSVIRVSGDVDLAMPRLVRSVDLPPNSELLVDLVYWDRRSPPFNDSDLLYIVSPPATFAEAMLAPLSLEPHQLDLEAVVVGKKPHRLSCRVWVDEARTLRLHEVPSTS